MRNYDDEILTIIWFDKTFGIYQTPIKNTTIDSLKLKIMSEFNLNPSNFDLHKYDASYTEYYDVTKTHCEGLVVNNCTKELVVSGNKYKKVASFIVVLKNKYDECDLLLREIDAFRI